MKQDGADIADGVAVVAGGTAVTPPTQPTSQSIVVPLGSNLESACLREQYRHRGRLVPLLDFTDEPVIIEGDRYCGRSCIRTAYS